MYIVGTIVGTNINWGTPTSSIVDDIGGTMIFGALNSSNVPCVMVVTTSGSNYLLKATSALTSSFTDYPWTYTHFTVFNVSTKVELQALASAGFLAIADDYSGPTYGIEAFIFDGAAWGTMAIKVPFDSTASPTLWATCQKSVTDIVFLGVSGANSFSFQKYDGSVWSTLTAPSWPSNNIATSGYNVSLTTDNTNYYAFIIGNDSNYTIYSSKYSGSSWGDWISLDSVAQKKSFIESGPYISSKNLIPVIWTYTTGSDFQIWTNSLNFSSPGAPSNNINFFNMKSMTGGFND